MFIYRHISFFCTCQDNFEIIITFTFLILFRKVVTKHNQIQLYIRKQVRNNKK